MTSIYGYSATAASNNAAAPDGAPENMPSSGVNDTMRKMMANLAEFVIAPTAGGSADALTVTPTNAVTALVDGMIMFVRAASANATTTPTFAPSGLTAHTITKNGGSALAAGDIAGAGHVLILQYQSSGTKWELLNPKGGAGTVTSVAASVPSILSISGSPITSSGTLAITLANQDANIVFAGPSSGSAAAPTFRSLVSADLPAGTVLQSVGAANSTYSTTATALPYDDTIPQNTEGGEITTVSITPKATSNVLEIEAFFVGGLTTSQNGAIALFQDSTADALQAAPIPSPATGTSGLTSAVIRHRMTAGTTSATTFKLRAGVSSGTLHINGEQGGSARKYGGALSCWIRVTEIKA